MLLEPSNALGAEQGRRGGLGRDRRRRRRRNGRRTRQGRRQPRNGARRGRDRVRREALQSIQDAAEVVGVRVVECLHVLAEPGDEPPVHPRGEEARVVLDHHVVLANLVGPDEPPLVLVLVEAAVLVDHGDADQGAVGVVVDSHVCRALRHRDDEIGGLVADGCEGCALGGHELCDVDRTGYVVADGRECRALAGHELRMLCDHGARDLVADDGRECHALSGHELCDDGTGGVVADGRNCCALGHVEHSDGGHCFDLATPLQIDDDDDEPLSIRQTSSSECDSLDL
ncbi:hypothetical protein KC19_11G067900 [Ceratodon purpureus]|uniref:Uncharacterized protein n=1 Tax=Ceratodon purpureus TaxID=3225 RepID=A0A8T0GDN4_CERPU|nr:hypothetical protein KC19_11G067900 [Ceratodon purpureus]